MRYYNLVYAKHNESDRRAYLYSLPLDKDVKPFDRLYVRDKHGEHIVTAFNENFFSSKGLTRVLCEANGGYFPPAEVIGTVDTITVKQDLVQPFANYDAPEPEYNEKEDKFPW